MISIFINEQNKVKGGFLNINQFAELLESCFISNTKMESVPFENGLGTL